jgi:hypothetical protein
LIILLRFNRLCIKLTLLFMPYAFFVLVPLNATSTYWERSSTKITSYFRWTVSNIAPESQKLWGHVGGMFLLSVMLIYLIDQELHYFQELRYRFLRERQPHRRTVIVEQIPPDLRSAAQLALYFATMYPHGSVAHVALVLPAHKLEELVERRMVALQNLEHALVMDRVKRSDTRFFTGGPCANLFGCGSSVSAARHWEEVVDSLNLEIAAEQAKWRARTRRTERRADDFAARAVANALGIADDNIDESALLHDVAYRVNSPFVSGVSRPQKKPSDSRPKDTASTALLRSSSTLDAQPLPSAESLPGLDLADVERGDGAPPTSPDSTPAMASVATTEAQGTASGATDTVVKTEPEPRPTRDPRGELLPSHPGESRPPRSNAQVADEAGAACAAAAEDATEHSSVSSAAGDVGMEQMAQLSGPRGLTTMGSGRSGAGSGQSGSLSVHSDEYEDGEINYDTDDDFDGEIEADDDDGAGNGSALARAIGSETDLAPVAPSSAADDPDDDRRSEAGSLKSETVRLGDENTPLMRRAARVIRRLCGGYDARSALPQYRQRLLKAKQEIGVKSSKFTGTTAFVTFRTYWAGAVAQQVLHAEEQGQMRVKPAPEARDLFWPNLHLSWRTKKARKLIVVMIITTIIVFFIVPIAWFDTYLSTAALKRHTWFTKLVKGRPLLLTLSGYVMPMALTGMVECVPGILTFLAIFEGTLSWSKNQMHQMDRYFAFLMINVFLVVSIGGAMLSVAEEIAKEPRELFTLLGESIPTMSGFFFDYMLLRGVAGSVFTLVRAGGFAQTLVKTSAVPNLSRRNLIQAVLGLRAWNNPGWYSYGKSFGGLLLGLVVLLCYAPLAPMILVAMLLYFIASWFISKVRGLLEDMLAHVVTCSHDTIAT